MLSNRQMVAVTYHGHAIIAADQDRRESTRAARLRAASTQRNEDRNRRIAEALAFARAAGAGFRRA